jgi:hypothetical protein
MLARLRWKAVLRDIVIVYGLTLLGGYLSGLAAAAVGDSRVQLVGSALFATLGFAISAWLTRENRPLHLIGVSIGVWLASALNMLAGIPVSAWLVSIVFLPPVMLAGAGITLLIERTTGRATESDTSPL